MRLGRKKQSWRVEQWNPLHPISRKRKPRPRDRKWHDRWLPVRGALSAASPPVLVRILQGRLSAFQRGN